MTLNGTHDNPGQLTFAVPKGRILDEALPVMARAGVEPDAEFHDPKSRALAFATNRADSITVRSLSSAFQRRVSSSWVSVIADSMGWGPRKV